MGCCPFDLEMCGFWSGNQLISNVLSVRDKSDEEEPEPVGWKTSEPREFVGVAAVFVPAFERGGGRRLF